MHFKYKIAAAAEKETPSSQQRPSRNLLPAGVLSRPTGQDTAPSLPVLLVEKPSPKLLPGVFVFPESLLRHRPLTLPKAYNALVLPARLQGLNFQKTFKRTSLALWGFTASPVFLVLQMRHRWLLVTPALTCLLPPIPKASRLHV